MATVVSAPPNTPAASSATVSPSVAAPPTVMLRKFTVDEYHLMARAGVFVDGDPFELLEGWIVKKMTKNPPHEQSILLVDASIRAFLPSGWILRPQAPITTRHSEPEPDFSVARGNLRSYPTHHPGPSDIGLVVEVADASLAQDRNVKGRIYAEAAIPIYWIVNIVDRQVEVYADPSGPAAIPAYLQQLTFRVGQMVPFVLDGQQIATIPVQDLLP